MFSKSIKLLLLTIIPLSTIAWSLITVNNNNPVSNNKLIAYYHGSVKRPLRQCPEIYQKKYNCVLKKKISTTASVWSTSHNTINSKREETWYVAWPAIMKGIKLDKSTKKLAKLSPAKVIKDNTVKPSLSLKHSDTSISSNQLMFGLLSLVSLGLVGVFSYLSRMLHNLNGDRYPYKLYLLTLTLSVAVVSALGGGYLLLTALGLI